MNLTTLLRANLDRVIALGLVLAGALLLVLGWVGVSGVALAAQQIPYLISGGLGGVFLGAVGVTVWLSADLHDEWRRLDAIEAALTSLADAAPSTAPAAETLELVPSTPIAASVGAPASKGVRVGKSLA